MLPNNTYKIIFLVFIFTCILASPAFADDPPKKLDPPDMIKCVKDNNEYVCFTPNDAQTLLQYRMDIPDLKLDLKKHKDLLKVKELQVEKLTNANAILLDTKHFLITENVRLQRELDNRDAWYKSPYLWFGVGLLVGAAGTITIMYIVK
jgi:hypothetical protein